ncbi:MAG: arginine deiminase-related protein [Flavobacteriaceae bacterium]
MSQSTNTILMVSPSTFGYNEESAPDNTFQKRPKSLEGNEIGQKLALVEFNEMVKKLRDSHVNVIVVKDELKARTTDSIFPNNWFSTHVDGSLYIYPMMAKNRRIERGIGIIEELSTRYIILNTIDFTSYEKENKFLEGTGSMVFDRENKIIYAIVSKRTDLDVLSEMKKSIGYEMILFNSVNEDNVPVYHTNVIMCVATTFIILCFESIKNEEERLAIIRAAERTNKVIIDISFEQVKYFCGNVIEIKNNKNEKLLAMSINAFNHFTKKQIETIENSHSIFTAEIPTIETLGGGGVRCMIAEIFFESL